jgi:hypothetical protein
MTLTLDEKPAPELPSEPVRFPEMADAIVQVQDVFRPLNETERRRVLDTLYVLLWGDRP